MAKKKTYHYYVLVFTNCGPVYVTKLGEGKTAYWNSAEKPYELGMYRAEEVCMGLNLNFYTSVVVKMPFELENQPYLYSDYEIVWKEKKEEEE